MFPEYFQRIALGKLPAMAGAEESRKRRKSRLRIAVDVLIRIPRMWTFRGFPLFARLQRACRLIGRQGWRLGKDLCRP